MALKEASVLDQNLGRLLTHNLAEYPAAVNANLHDIEIIFVPEHDKIVHPPGAKCLSEIGIVGVPAAISHATGKRVRDFPITLDKLL